MNVRIGKAEEYELGAGFVIELRRHWNRDVETWALPDWEECGLPLLGGKFPSVASARRALSKYDIATA
jgi:hypothetical protein